MRHGSTATERQKSGRGESKRALFVHHAYALFRISTSIYLCTNRSLSFASLMSKYLWIEWILVVVGFFPCALFMTKMVAFSLIKKSVFISSVISHFFFFIITEQFSGYNMKKSRDKTIKTAYRCCPIISHSFSLHICVSDVCVKSFWMIIKNCIIHELFAINFMYMYMNVNGEWWMCEWQFLFIVYADKYGDGVYDLCMFVSVCLCVCPRMWQYMSFYYTHPLAFIRW